VNDDGLTPEDPASAFFPTELFRLSACSAVKKLDQLPGKLMDGRPFSCFNTLPPADHDRSGFASML
jgi:hypothetical protein